MESYSPYITPFITGAISFFLGIFTANLNSKRDNRNKNIDHALDKLARTKEDINKYWLSHNANQSLAHKVQEGIFSTSNYIDKVIDLPIHDAIQIKGSIIRLTRIATGGSFASSLHKADLKRAQLASTEVDTCIQILCSLR